MTGRSLALDESVDRVRRALDAAGANLRELESYPTFRLLSTTRMGPATTAAWGAVRDDLTTAWTGHLALSAHLDRIDALRGPSRRTPRQQVSTVARMLSEPVVQVTLGAWPVTSRPLTGEEVLTRDFRVDDLFAVMAAAFERAGRLLAQVDDVWARSVPAIERAQAQLGSAVERTQTSGLRVSSAARAVLAELSALRSLCDEDPLAVDGVTVDALVEGSSSLEADLERGLRTQSEYADRMASLTALVDAAATELARAEKAWTEVSAKVILRPLGADMNAWCADLETLRADVDRTAAEAGTDWAATDRRLRGLEARASSLATRAGRSRDALTQDLETRDALRGRLAAYRAKACARGFAEDIELGDRHEVALQCLHTAPCDLAEAAVLLDAYAAAIAVRSGEP